VLMPVVVFATEAGVGVVVDMKTPSVGVGRRYSWDRVTCAQDGI
jgi:hypothetical protein